LCGTSNIDAHFEPWSLGTVTVAELVKILVVNFNDGEGILKLNPDWRWED
jgi:hypothetical protein